MATTKKKPVGRVRRVASAATDFVIDEVQNVLASARDAIDIGRRSVQKARKPVKEQVKDTAGRTTRAVSKAVTPRKSAKRKSASRSKAPTAKTRKRNVSVTVKTRKAAGRPKRAKATRRKSRARISA